MDADEKPIFERTMALPGRPGAVLASAIVLFGGIPLTGHVLATRGTHSALFWVFAIIQSLAFLRLMVLLQTSLRRAATVSVTSAGVSFRVTNVRGMVMEDETIARSAIQAVSIARRTDKSTHVILGDRDGKTLLELDGDDATARELVAAIGLDESARVASFETTGALGAVGYVALAFVLVPVILTLVASAVAPWVLLGAAALVAAIGRRRSRVAIARDGVRVTSWLGSTRFLSFRDVSGVEQGSGRRAAWLIMKNGARIPIPALTSIAIAEHRVVYDRVREAFAAWSERGAVLAARFSRAGRGAHEWVESLRKRLRETDYREAPVDDEALLALVEDPTAPEDARAAAAIALADGARPEAVARIRVAAEATASPRLRIALGAAALNDEAASVRALAELLEDDDAPEPEAREAIRSR